MCTNNNCLDCNPCPEEEVQYQEGGCLPEQTTLTSCGKYNGLNLKCIPVVTGEGLNSVIYKFDAAVCEFVAGSDRRVGVTDLDTLPGTLSEKIIDSTYIKWASVDVDGEIKFMASIDVDELASAVCGLCTSFTTTAGITTTLAPTTTVPPAPTTTIPPTTSTTTLTPNVEARNNVLNTQILSISGIPGFSVGAPVDNGSEVKGRHNSFNSVIAVTIAGIGGAGSSIILRRNGITLECINVSGPGTYTFTATPFILTDICSIETVAASCPVVTSTTTTEAIVTPTTTIPPTTTLTTTRMPNVIVLSQVSGTSITSVGGVSGFVIPQSVEAGEVVTGNHNGFTGVVNFNVFGIVTGASAVLYRNGIALQCVSVNGQGVVTFNSQSFSNTDILQISFLSSPCIPVTTSTTTTVLPPCNTYRIENNTGTTYNISYFDCAGVSVPLIVNSDSTHIICAQEGSIPQMVGVTVTLLSFGCNLCFTYEIVNTSLLTGTFEYVDCYGNAQGGTIGLGSTVRICAERGSLVSSVGFTELDYGCSLTSTTTTGVTGTTTTVPVITSTTTTSGITVEAYFGLKDVGTPPTEGEILAGTNILTNPEPLTLNWGVQPVTPKFYWFAIPAGTNYTYYFQSALNQASIGTEFDLFNAPTAVTVDGQAYEVYVTNYATQFVNNADYVFTYSAP